MSVWKKINSKIIHENSWFCLREDDVIRPDGKPGKYFYVDNVNGVAIVVEEGDSVYLIGQTRYPIGNIYSWEVVGGGVEKDEDMSEAAQRELKEETGFTAKNWIDLGYFYNSNSYSTEKVNVFLATDLEKGEMSPDVTEDIKVKRVSLEELKNMIKNNEMTDGFSIAAINKYFLYKNL